MPQKSIQILVHISATELLLISASETLRLIFLDTFFNSGGRGEAGRVVLFLPIPHFTNGICSGRFED